MEKQRQKAQEIRRWTDKPIGVGQKRTKTGSVKQNLAHKEKTYEINQPQNHETYRNQCPRNQTRHRKEKIHRETQRRQREESNRTQVEPIRAGQTITGVEKEPRREVLKILQNETGNKLNPKPWHIHFAGLFYYYYAIKVIINYV